MKFTSFKDRIPKQGTSLVAQWLRIHLPDVENGREDMRRGKNKLG